MNTKEKKIKEIHEFLQSIVKSLSKKVESEADNVLKYPEIAEYTKGQLYEAQYILGKIEDIIYKE